MNVRRLRRPQQWSNADEVATYRRRLAKAQEELGVAYGAEFVILSTEEFDALRRPSLLDGDRPGAARTDDPQTSKDAAKYPGRNSQRWRVLMAIRSAAVRGATAEEVARITGIEYRSVTPRIGELRNAGFIEGNGETRTSSLDNQQEVLVLTMLGALEMSTHDPVGGIEG